MEERFDCRPAQWLRRLFYIHIASIVIYIVAYLFPGDVSFWVDEAVSLAIVFCLYSLGPENERYRKAAILVGAAVALTVLNKFLPALIFSTAASVLLILAAYQEYHAHSKLILGRDSNLAWKWQSLFKWEIAVDALVILLGIAVTVFTVAGSLGGALVTGILTLVAGVASLVLGILYLVYLWRTVRLMEEREYTI